MKIRFNHPAGLSGNQTSGRANILISFLFGNAYLINGKLRRQTVLIIFQPLSDYIGLLQKNRLEFT